MSENVQNFKAGGLIPYPADPFPSLGIIISKLRGEASVGNAQAIHAAYEALGCGLGAFVPDKEVSFSAMSDNDAADTIERCCKKDDKGFSAGSFPWEVLIPVLMNKLSEWITAWLRK